MAALQISTGRTTNDELSDNMADRVSVLERKIQELLENKTCNCTELVVDNVVDTIIEEAMRAPTLQKADEIITAVLDTAVENVRAIVDAGFDETIAPDEGRLELYNPAMIMKKDEKPEAPGVEISVKIGEVEIVVSQREPKKTGQPDLVHRLETNIGIAERRHGIGETIEQTEERINDDTSCEKEAVKYVCGQSEWRHVYFENFQECPDDVLSECEGEEESEEVNDSTEGESAEELEEEAEVVEEKQDDPPLIQEGSADNASSEMHGDDETSTSSCECDDCICCDSVETLKADDEDVDIEEDQDNKTISDAEDSEESCHKYSDLEHSAESLVKEDSACESRTSSELHLIQDFLDEIRCLKKKIAKLEVIKEDADKLSEAVKELKHNDEEIMEALQKEEENRLMQEYKFKKGMEEKIMEVEDHMESYLGKEVRSLRAHMKQLAESSAKLGPAGSAGRQQLLEGQSCIACGTNIVMHTGDQQRAPIQALRPRALRIHPNWPPAARPSTVLRKTSVQVEDLRVPSEEIQQLLAPRYGVQGQRHVGGAHTITTPKQRVVRTDSRFLNLQK